MQKERAVITIHGMGHHPEDYAQAFQTKLKNFLNSDQEKVHFESIYYHDLCKLNKKPTGTK